METPKLYQGMAMMLIALKGHWSQWAGEHWCCDAHEWLSYPQERCGYCQHVLDTRYPHLSALRGALDMPPGGMARARQEAKALRRRMARDATKGRRGARAIEHQLVDPILDGDVDLYDPRLPRRPPGPPAPRNRALTARNAKVSAASLSFRL